MMRSTSTINNTTAASTTTATSTTTRPNPFPDNDVYDGDIMNGHATTNATTILRRMSIHLRMDTHKKSLLLLSQFVRSRLSS